MTFAGRGDLAERCEVDVGTISANLKRLEEAGLIARVDRNRANGSKTTPYIVLAPSARCADRSPMLDAVAEHGWPDEIMALAKSNVAKPNVSIPNGEGLENPRAITVTDNSKDTPVVPKGTDEPDPVERIFDYWKKVMNHPGAQLDDARRRKIVGALKHSTPEECAQAILGCSKSDYHMARGQYQGGTRYDKLSLCLRNREFIEDFCAKAPQGKAGTSRPAPFIDPLEREYVKAIRLANQMQGSSDAQTRAKVAETNLKTRGWTIVTDDDGHVRFTMPDGDSF